MCIFRSMCYSGPLGLKTSSTISKLNLQSLAIFAAKCGKFLYISWQNLGFQMAVFHAARLMLAIIILERETGVGGR